jgi:hypothetical protein
MLQCSVRVLRGGGVEKHYEGMGDFSKFVRYEVGDGFEIRLWHDVWCGDCTLKEAFPVLYSITCLRRPLRPFVGCEQHILVEYHLHQICA